MKSEIHRKKITLVKGVWRLIGLMCAVYLFMFAIQRHLVFPTHFANAQPCGVPSDYHLQDFEVIKLVTRDGVKIEGWFHAPANHMPVILYLHGNGNNVAARHQRYDNFVHKGYGIFALEYRGYGHSEGSPSEEGLYNDARAAMDWLHQHNLSKIIPFGESLGSGIAVEMAKEYPVSGLVLDSAYTSIRARVAEIYWFFPGIHYLVRDNFDSLSKIADIHVPVLIFHGDQDTVVPIEHGKRLAQALKDHDMKFICVAGAGHVGIPDSLILSTMDDFFIHSHKQFL